MSYLDNYTLGKTLGSGFSAKVKLGTLPNGDQHALKIFRLDNPAFDEKAFKLLTEEDELIIQLNHENIVKIYTFSERATMHKASGVSIQVAYIAQEMIPGGELFDYVANSGPFSENICQYYFKQML